MKVEVHTKHIDELTTVTTIKYNMYDRKHREERGSLVLKLGNEGFKHITTIEHDYWKVDVLQKTGDPCKEIKEEEKAPFEPDQLELVEEPNLFNYIELEGPNVTELQPDWFRVDMMVSVKDIAVFYGVSQKRVNEVIEELHFETYPGSGKYTRRFRSIGGTDQPRLEMIHSKLIELIQIYLTKREGNTMKKREIIKSIHKEVSEVSETKAQFIQVLMGAVIRVGVQPRKAVALAEDIFSKDFERANNRVCKNTLFDIIEDLNPDWWLA
ncbi:hypothetical protein PDN05_00790 [Bacillus cereus]|nr:hypothetical protein [Bacillus cereus]